MSKEKIIVGLDVGTSNVRTVVAKVNFEEGKPQILGVGEVPSFGLRRGVVVDIEETVKSIEQSIRQAEQASGLPIKEVYVSLGGDHLTCQLKKGVVAVSRADNEISEEDVQRAIEAVSNVASAPNREIIHIIPRCFNVDNQSGIKDPVGMTGIRLEVESLLVEAATPFVKNLTKCINEAGLEIMELVAAPLAAARAVLNKRQRELGVLALDLGGGTANMTVFEEGDIIYLYVLPIGSAHITSDLAIGLRSSLDVAERVKLEYGSALIEEISKKEMIDLSKLGLDGEGVVPRRQVVQIIEARLSEILELTNKNLKKIGRQGLLPAGVVLLGGGAKTPGLVDLVKKELRLPAQIGFPLEVGGLVDQVDDPAFATALGLVFWGMDMEGKEKQRQFSFRNKFNFLKFPFSKAKQWLQEFLP